MSYLLSQIDNNRSEDDEDERINRLFPKCKPRVSPQSQSPATQRNDPSSSGSASGSDPCLNSKPPATPQQNHNQKFIPNSNLALLEEGRVRNQNYQESGRRHSSSNSSSRHIVNDISLLSQGETHLWGSEEQNDGEGLFSSDNIKTTYENNNIGSSSDYYWTNSLESLTNNHHSSDIYSSNRLNNHHHNHHPHHNNHQQRRRSSSSKKKNSENYSIHNQDSSSFTSKTSLNNKCDRDNNPKTVSGYPLRHCTTSKSAEHKEKVVKVEGHSVISSSDRNRQTERGSKSEPQQKNMESHNSIEDNFENGMRIGSSGESNHSHSSNTYDFMENLVSPRGGSRIPPGPKGVVGGGGHSPNPNAPSTPASLRDSRIEIAGGREIYSQNRIRASRRHHRGSSNNEIMSETASTTTPPCSLSSSKISRKKASSIPPHTHLPPTSYQHQHPHQHHHCCHSNPPLCGTCGEMPALSPHGSMVWESHSRRGSEVVPGRQPQQYAISHSHSFGGTGQCVKCTGPSACRCCGHHVFEPYTKTAGVMEYDGENRICRNSHKLHNSNPTSPMTVRETIFSSEVKSIEKSAPRGSQINCELESPCRMEPVIYESCVEDGKVVFDDIGEWREREGREGGADNGGYEAGDEGDSQGSRKRQQLPPICPHKEVMKCRRSFSCTGGPGPLQGSPCASNRDGNTTPSGYESDECSASVGTTISASQLKMSPNFVMKGGRLIGNLPIAEYEGSPKRYGLKQPCNPVTTHFDLIDVETGVEVSGGGDRDRDNDQIINEGPNTQSLVDQSTAAATSSSSSSLDNTNTNVSSNSSSRTNNHISPRALSPSQTIATFSARFPGFPQRVSACPPPPVPPEEGGSNANNTNTRTASSSYPLQLVYQQQQQQQELGGPNQELLSSVDKDSTTGDSLSNGMKPGESSGDSNITTTMSQVVAQGPTSGSEQHQLIRMESSSSSSGATNMNHETLSSEQHNGGLQCNLLDDNFLVVDSPHSQIVRPFVTSTISTSTTNTNTTTTGNGSGGTITYRNQDFLYEFSETRKVLEEFFGGRAHCSSGGIGGGDKASFDELDYMLRRQSSGNGSSYVGQRLANDDAGHLQDAEDSPQLQQNNTNNSKPPPTQRRGILVFGSSDGESGGGLSDEKGSPKLISFQEIPHPPPPQPPPQVHSSSSPHNTREQSGVRTSCTKFHSRPESQSPPLPLHDPTRDINDNDIDAETASTNTETDFGEAQVRRGRRRDRRFAGGVGVSPETTDCDSNELESELSLDYHEASLHPHRGGGGGSRRRARIVVAHNQDGLGLSSGNESENDETIEVDVGVVGFRNDDATNCYGLMGNKIKQISLAKRQTSGGELPNDAKLFSCEENKENVLCVTHPGMSEQMNNEPLSRSRTEDLMQSGMLLVDDSKSSKEMEQEIQSRASEQRNQKPQANGMANNLLDKKMELTTNKLEQELNHQQQTSPPISLDKTNGSSGIDNDTKQPPLPVESKNPFLSKGPDGIDKELSRSKEPTSCHDPELDALDPMRKGPTPPPSPAPPASKVHSHTYGDGGPLWRPEAKHNFPSHPHNNPNPPQGRPDNLERLSERRPTDPDSSTLGMVPSSSSSGSSVAAAIQDIKEAIQRTKPLPHSRHSTVNNYASTYSSNRTGHLESQSQHSPESHERVPLICDSSPVWVPRHARPSRGGSDSQGAKDPLLRKSRYDDTPEDDADTDQETDRLLGQTRTEDDCGFYDDKDWKKPKSRSLLPALNKGVAFVKSAAAVPSHQLPPGLSSSASICASNSFNNATTINSTSFQSANNVSSSSNNISASQQLINHSSCFDESPQKLLPSSTIGSAPQPKPKKEKDGVKKKRSKEDFLENPSVLIEGVLFRARYLGSTQLTCEGQPTKATRMMQAEEAVSRIKDEQNNASGTNNELQQEASSVSPVVPVTTTSSSSPPSNSHSDTATGGGIVSNSNPCRINEGPNNKESEVDEYFYGVEEEESCCEGESDLEDDLFLKSGGSLRDNKGLRLPLDDSLQIHDNHPLSLHHHNRQPSGESCPGGVTHPSFLNLSPPCASALPGTMFRLRFIGSLDVDEESGSGKRRRKRPKKTMVEEAVMKLKSMAPEGETQPSTEVDLFISTEKIMVLNTDLKEIMMDHALRTISYIADIGDLVVLMARRRPVPSDPVDESRPPRLPKMICHVFESEEAQYIAQSIGQAFQVAYMEFLKANGIEDNSFVREMDYQEVLNSQEIFGDELQMFAKKELQKEVVVPKSKGEILGVVIVESGWGSMLPTVVIANLAPAGAAARCGQLNIGDQIIAINGVSLVGLPLSTCQNYIKNTKNQTVVKLTVVPCPPVVEVKIKRPDTKYQLGFSVQNGVICSLLRGGIAERGGVRVGHRIIEINSQSVVAVPHEKIVNLLATSVGEINMKTMPTSMFRLLTGQETPLHI